MLKLVLSFDCTSFAKIIDSNPSSTQLRETYVVVLVVELISLRVQDPRIDPNDFLPPDRPIDPNSPTGWVLRVCRYTRSSSKSEALAGFSYHFVLDVAFPKFKYQLQFFSLFQKTRKFGKQYLVRISSWIPIPARVKSKRPDLAMKTYFRVLCRQFSSRSVGWAQYSIFSITLNKVWNVQFFLFEILKWCTNSATFYNVNRA